MEVAVRGCASLATALLRKAPYRHLPSKKKMFFYNLSRFKNEILDRAGQERAQHRPEVKSQLNYRDIPILTL